MLTQLTLYPAGSVSVLPTILCLTTNVLRETAEPSLDGKSAPTVTSCMQALRSLATCSFVKDPRCANDWEKFLQSTLATILDYSNPGIKLSSFTGRTNFSKLSSIQGSEYLIKTHVNSILCIPRRFPFIMMVSRNWLQLSLFYLCTRSVRMK